MLLIPVIEFANQLECHSLRVTKSRHSDRTGTVRCQAGPMEPDHAAMIGSGQGFQVRSL
jgi:hypothetical protein